MTAVDTFTEALRVAVIALAVIGLYGGLWLRAEHKRNRKGRQR